MLNSTNVMNSGENETSDKRKKIDLFSIMYNCVNQFDLNFTTTLDNTKTRIQKIVLIKHAFQIM